MTEDFLHYLWRYRYFDSRRLYTVSGEPLQIIRTGEHNTNAGPDFFNARLKIGNTEWAGNVEIHVRSSDWERHRHQQDDGYDNTILHVVYEYDLPVSRKDKSILPVLELKGRIDLSVWRTYRELQKSAEWIPCGRQLKNSDPIILTGWLDRMLVERMEKRAELILSSLSANKNDWEETFYLHLSRNFGFKVNALPFELLAKSLPLKILSRHRNNLFQTEALLFGQSGMLFETYKDTYPAGLTEEYDHLRKKFSLRPVAPSLWKFLRMRPSNFPTVRIAQLAALIHKTNKLFSSVLECETVKNIQDFFSLQASSYWNNHYRFDSFTEGGIKRMGEESVMNIMINTVAPFLFVYGKKKNDETFCGRALRFFEQLPPESNSIIAGWKKYGVTPVSSAQSQSMIHLKNHYCINKKCLTCAIGNSILSKPAQPHEQDH